MPCQPELALDVVDSPPPLERVKTIYGIETDWGADLAYDEDCQMPGWSAWAYVDPRKNPWARLGFVDIRRRGYTELEAVQAVCLAMGLPWPPREGGR